MERQKNESKRRAGGNTNSPAKSEKGHRKFCFTWNNYKKDSKSELIEYFNGRKNLLYIFQEETGENGTPHLQGCFKSKSPIFFSTLKKLFPIVHWEICKDWKASVKYCSKDDTRTGGCFTNMMDWERVKLNSGFDIVKACQWQLDIIKLMEEIEPDNRIIHWIWSKKGKMGKTSLARYLVDTYPNQIIYLDGKGADIKYGIQKFLENKKNNLKLAIFGFTRSKEDYVSYDAIEAIKDGIFFSGKYEAGMVRFNSPHIVVLANFPPKISALSIDR